MKLFFKSKSKLKREIEGIGEINGKTEKLLFYFILFYLTKLRLFMIFRSELTKDIIRKNLKMN